MGVRGRKADFCANRSGARRGPVARGLSVRRAAAAVELALVLPFLLTIFVASVDFARAFYSAQVLADCARTTALFVANPDLADKTSHESALALGVEYVKALKPQPTIAIVRGTDSEARAYVEVTVSQNFKLICPFMFRSDYQLTRTARARLFPAALEGSDGHG